MLLEVLEPGAVERIHLVDQMWPMANAKESGPTQITWGTSARLAGPSTAHTQDQSEERRRDAAAREVCYKQRERPGNFSRSPPLWCAGDQSNRTFQSPPGQNFDDLLEAVLSAGENPRCKRRVLDCELRVLARTFSYACVFSSLLATDDVASVTLDSSGRQQSTLLTCTAMTGMQLPAGKRSTRRCRSAVATIKVWSNPTRTPQETSWKLRLPGQ